MGGIDGLADTVNMYALDPVDTMSVLLDWAVLYLAYFPDVQRRLQQRIEEVRQSLKRLFRVVPNQIFQNFYLISIGL